MSFNLSDLNELQYKITMDTEGAILVTAGAGSGKTRLLTHRIAHIIRDLEVPASNVLAITFTNKATNEMKERLAQMLPPENCNVWISTFHSMCARILRENIDRLDGFDRFFTVFDDADKDKLIKAILKEFGLDNDSKDSLVNFIANAKNLGLTPSEYQKECPVVDIKMLNMYELYQKRLKENNALDFDDLLLKTLEIFYSCSEVLRFYQQKFRYIHVDEFQDTNLVQYKIVKLLAGLHKNIFVVGDEDQCIYCWRGANIENIADFRADFDCKVYKLEQNYRSTGNIIKRANMLIKNNMARIDKTLFTKNPDGDEVSLHIADDETAESEYVVSTIATLKNRGVNYKDIGILMRVSALSRLIEEKLLNYNIPYQVAGIMKFYERLEIKNVLAYLRLFNNHKDNYAISRIINYPKRGIGEASILKLTELSSSIGVSVFDIITHYNDYKEISGALKTKLAGFAEQITSLDAVQKELDLYSFAKKVVNDTGIRTMYSTTDEDDINRRMNIDQLLQSIKSYSENNPDADLTAYLESVTLENDLSSDDNGDDKVSVSTVHAAKGLEFDYVFVIGCEEGRFPLCRDGDSDIEEERRLMYVAVTRARKKLYLTRARSRFMYGRRDIASPSKFLREMDLEKPEDMWKQFSTSSYGYGVSKSFNQYGDSRGRSSSTYGSTWSTKPQNGSAVGVNKSAFGTNANTQKLENELSSLFKAKKTSDKYAGFIEGAKVSHDKFGIGTIIKKESMGDNTIVTIKFDKIGVKTLSLQFAPLKLVN